MGSETLVLHPGSHVGAGEEAGIEQIIKGLDMVMKQDMKVKIALETMAGKGSEIVLSKNLKRFMTACGIRKISACALTPAM